jgi:hypothetical protein
MIGVHRDPSPVKDRGGHTPPVQAKTAIFAWQKTEGELSWASVDDSYAVTAIVIGNPPGKAGFLLSLHLMI